MARQPVHRLTQERLERLIAIWTLSKGRFGSQAGGFFYAGLGSAVL
jgi:hypothetical protein